MRRGVLNQAVDFVAVPWGMFVATFLYYVALTLAAIGVERISDRAVAVSYLAPVVAYSAVLLVRAVHAIPFGHPARMGARHA